MLCVTIEHYKDETVSIQEISDDSTVLARITENNTIDLDVCVPYINKEIAVQHKYTDNEKMNCTLSAKLEAVEIDQNTQIKCIKYSML